MGPDQDNQNTPNPSMVEPPENQTPPQSSNDPAPMGGSPKSKKKMWLWIVIILLVVLALIAGWLWWKDKDKKDETANTNNNSQQQTETETATCDEGLTTYENEDLGVGFCYPTNWGEVTVADARLMAETTDEVAADKGQRWRLSFADKAAVNLGLVSEDWSTEVGRGGSCVDPATQTLPAFSPFSTEWETEGDTATFASRGVEVEADTYLIEETADEFYNGVCITGYTVIDNETFPHSTASYYAEFGGAVTTPQQHVDNPNTLAPEADREEFYAFVKSVRGL